MYESNDCGAGLQGVVGSFPQPRTEQGGADAHDARPFGDRRLEIIRHAHGQGVEVGQFLLQPLQRRVQLPEHYPGLIEIRAWCGYGHQSAQMQVGKSRDLPGQRRQAGQADPGLAGLLADVDLQADIQGREPRRALRGQALGDLEAIDAMHPGELLGDRAGLVGLDRADKVPGQREVGQLGDLIQCLLQVVLAEVALSEGGQVANFSAVTGGRPKRCSAL